MAHSIAETCSTLCTTLCTTAWNGGPARECQRLFNGARARLFVMPTVTCGSYMRLENKQQKCSKDRIKKKPSQRYSVSIRPVQKKTQNVHASATVLICLRILNATAVGDLPRNEYFLDNAEMGFNLDTQCCPEQDNFDL